MMRGNPTLSGVAKWATPTAMDSHASGGNPANPKSGETLTDQAVRRPASARPTPAASDGKRAVSPDERDRPEGYTLSATVSHFSLPDPETPPDGKPSSGSTRVLNPLFVEWLMGLPIGWTDALSAPGTTDCAPSGTAWCRWLRRWRSYVCAIA